MKSSIISLVLIALLFASCEKNPDNITVTLNQSGTLKVKVTDDSHNGVSKAKLSIYYRINDGFDRIFYDSTDASGILDVGKLLEGSYEYYLWVKKDNRIYNSHEYFQVIAGNEKTIEVNPFLNIGNVTVSIVNVNNEPITDVNVALIPHPKYSNVYYTFESLLKEAYFTGAVNSKGSVRIEKIPTEWEYSVLIYRSSTEYEYPNYNNYVYAIREEERSFTIQAYLIQ
jgi:hypothetical protein